LEWGKESILRMSPGFVLSKMCSSVTEAGTCGVSEAEISGIKRKRLCG